MAKVKQSIIEDVDLDAPLKLWRIVDKNRTDRSWLMSTFDIWMVKEGKSINTIVTYMRIIEELIPKDRFDYPKISAREIDDFLRDKSSLYSSATRTFLRFVFSEFGRKFSSIEFKKYKSNRDHNDIQILSEKEISKVIKSLPDDRKLFTEMLYVCALRINEAYRIKVGDFRWEEWDQDTDKHGLLILHKTKSGKKRKILVNPSFMNKIYKFLIERDGRLILDNPLFKFKRFKKYFKKKLKLMEEGNIGCIFGYDDKKLLQYRKEIITHNFIKMKRNSFEKLFRKRCKEVLGKPSHPHVLRASRLTYLLNSKMPIIQVRNFAGHQSIVSTEFYLNSELEDMRNTMEDFNL